MLPNIITKSGIRKTTQVRFGGLDLRPEAGDGTFRETRGLNIDRLPFLAPREDWLTTQMDGLSAMVGMGAHLITAVGQGEIQMDGQWICNASPSGPITKLVPFGDRLVLPETREIIQLRYPIIDRVQRADELPDTETEGNAWLVGGGRPELWLWQSGAWVDAGPLIENLERSVGPFPMIFRDGNCQGEEARANTIEINSNLWLMPSVDPAQLPKFTDHFQPGDAVTISGCYGRPENNLTLIVREVSERELRFYENSFKQSIGQFTVGADGLSAGLYECTGWFQADRGRSGTEAPHVYFQLPSGTRLQAGDYIRYINPTISQFNPDYYVYIEAYVQCFHKDGTEYQDGKALLSASWNGGSTSTPTKLPFVETEDSAGMYHGELNVSVSKKWPEGLEGLFADSNRLWGWQGNRIRACKLGDPSNWEFFDGTAEDAWAVEVQRPGAFTGGISANGYPTFFKEDLRIRVYGSRPAEFSTSEQDCSGVRAGCAGSMVILDESLFYVSRLGVMQDSGAVPFLISQALGDLRLLNAVGAGCGTKLWLTGTGEADQGGRILCYDKAKGIWVEDAGETYDLMAEADGVCFLGGGGELIAMQGTAPAQFLFSDWEPTDDTLKGWVMRVKTNIYTMQQPNRKRVHRVQIRAKGAGTASLTVSIKYDSAGTWERVQKVEWTGAGYQSVYLPVLPRRCDHFQLDLVAVGNVEIQSLALETKSGSAIH